MVIFHSYVSLPEGKSQFSTTIVQHVSWFTAKITITTMIPWYDTFGGKMQVLMVEHIILDGDPLWI